MAWSDLVKKLNKAGQAKFGEPVVYTAPSASAESITGIFREEHELADVGDVPINTLRAAVHVIVADLAAPPVRNAEVLIRAKTYRVVEIEGPNDKGVVVLVLELKP